MKTLAIIFLMFIGTVSAEQTITDKLKVDQQRMIINNLSKRPYSAPVESKLEVKKEEIKDKCVINNNTFN